MSNKMIIVLANELERLTERDMMLTALESAGVDNWYAYEYAMGILDEMKSSSQEEDAYAPNGGTPHEYKD